MSRLASLVFTTSLLMSATALAAGTAGNSYNLSCDTGSLANAPLYTFTTGTQFKIRCKVIDQATGAGITAITNTQLIIQAGKNATTNTAWTAGTQYTRGAMTEVGLGVYDWTVTINSGVASGDIAQFEMRETGGTEVDAQRLSATVYVKASTAGLAGNAHTVEIQPSTAGDITAATSNYNFKVKFFDATGAAYNPGTLTWALNRWRDSAGATVTVGSVTGTWNAAGYYDCVLNTHIALTTGNRQYITISATSAGYVFMVNMGLTAVTTQTNTPLAVPTFTSGDLFSAPGTTAGTVTAVASTCSAIAVSAPYTGDSNGNNSLSYRYRTPTGTGLWSGATALPHAATYAPTLPGLTFNATYDVEVTYLDADGVIGGAATQTVSNILVGAPCTGAGTATATQVAGPTPSLALSGPWTGDSNANNSASWRWKTPSGGGAYGAANPIAHAASPYAATLAGLTCGSTYDLEFTYLDADGIGSGTAVQTLVNPALNQCTLVGAASGVVNACTQITVSAAFSNNTDLDGATAFARGPSATGPWTAVAACSAVTGASPRACVDTTALASTTYYYQATTTDPDGVTGAAAVTGALTTGACNVPQITPGLPVVTVNSCTQLTVSAPFTGDLPVSNSTTTFSRGPSATGPWTAICAGVVGASPRSCVMPSLTMATAWWVKVDFADADGVTGSASQIVGPSSTFDCRVAPGAPTSVANSCTQVTVSAPFSGDWDNNSSAAFARGTTAGGPWTAVAGCSAVTGASPRSCVDTGVTASTAWYHQVTFTDLGGITGTNPVVTAAAATTPACASSLTVSSGTGQPAAGNVAAGTVGTVVGKLTLTSAAGAITLTDLKLSNSGTAVADVDVQGLLLFEDVNGNGLIEAGDNLLSAGTWSAAESKYLFTGLSFTVTSPTARNLAVTLNAAAGATATRTFTMRALQADVYVAAPNTVSPTNFPIAGNAFTFIAGAWSEGDPTANSTRPMVAIVNPSNNAAVSCDGPAGTTGFRVQAQGYSAAAMTSVTLSTDNGTSFPITLVKNANYGGTANDGIWEAAVKLNPGSYVLVARATNGSGSVDSSRLQLTVNALGVGDGNLLVRDNSSQLCVDCHALKNHSSQSTSTQYGSWATTCRDCHAPHGTTNIFLIRNQITPPAVNGVQSAKTVKFWHTAGATDAGASFANEGTNNGPCQVCHTRTQSASSAARWRNTGNADTHYTVAIGTQPCTNCHSHAEGFGAGESGGGLKCSTCHKTIWDGMTGAVAKTSKHSIGNVVATNDSPTDTAVTWGSPLSSTVAASRSCVNMCHSDHIHNGVDGGVLHDPNAYSDPTSLVSRTMGRAAGKIISGTPTRTDFEGAATTGGMCVTCHTNPIDVNRGITVTKATFTPSAHNYVTQPDGGRWTYSLHDGSKFDRNCTKCHSEDSPTGAFDLAASGLDAVHSSGNAALLSGTKNPNNVPANFVCFNCHGSGAAGAASDGGFNLSGKNIALQVGKLSKHPTNLDNVHNTSLEADAGAFGNALGGVARHVSCLDCHDPHEAKAGTHDAGTNFAGPPLQGAWGAELTTRPAFWAAPTAASFTKKSIVAGVDLEATLCFKCHSSYYGTLPQTPSGDGGFVETDTAREFNPANVGNYDGGTTASWASGETAGGFHPVLAASTNLGAVIMTNLVTTNIAWRTTGARNLMACSDCHESNSATDPNGPHGSTASFILRGPNTNWSPSVLLTATGMPAGTFCLNCHSGTFASSRFSQHTNGKHNVACFNCHAAIPHGGPRPGILISGAGAGANVGGVIAGWDQTAPYWQGTASNRLYLIAYPATSTTAWAQGNCGCNGTGH